MFNKFILINSILIIFTASFKERQNSRVASAKIEITSSVNMEVVGGSSFGNASFAPALAGPPSADSGEPEGAMLTLDKHNRETMCRDPMPNWEDIRQQVEEGIQSAYEAIGGHPHAGSLASQYPFWLVYVEKGQACVAILGWASDEDVSCAKAQNVKMGGAFALKGERGDKYKDILGFMMAKVLVSDPRTQPFSGWWAEISPPILYSILKRDGVPVVMNGEVAGELVPTIDSINPCSEKFMGSFYDEEARFYACFERAIKDHKHEKLLVGCPLPYRRERTLRPNPFSRTGGTLTICVPAARI